MTNVHVVHSYRRLFTRMENIQTNKKKLHLLANANSMQRTIKWKNENVLKTCWVSNNAHRRYNKLPIPMRPVFAIERSVPNQTNRLGLFCFCAHYSMFYFDFIDLVLGKLLTIFLCYFAKWRGKKNCYLFIIWVNYTFACEQNKWKMVRRRKIRARRNNKVSREKYLCVCFFSLCIFRM